MRHDLRESWRAFGLRPIGLDDAAFVAELRSGIRAAGKLHPISGSVADQTAWLDSYLVRPGDWYWIVERLRDGLQEGTLGIWQLEDGPGRAQWGRWILRAGSMAAAESALLVYSVAFERIGLNEVYCRTVATNGAVISFHDRAGLERVGAVPDAFQFGASAVEAVEHRLRRENWPATRAILRERADQVAQLLDRRANP